MSTSSPSASVPDNSRALAFSRARKQKIKDALVAVAAANWCFVRPSFGLLFDRNRYFNKLPVTSVELLALMFNIAALAVIVWAGIRLWRHCRKSSWIPLALEIMFLSLMIFPLDFVRGSFLGLTVARVIAILKGIPELTALSILVPLALWKHRLVARIAAVSVAVTSPVALLFLGKEMLLCLGILHLNQCAVSQPPASMLPAREGQPRVVWIIFDEMDYRLAFEQRPPSVTLPEFDRLCAESLSANTAYAPGDATLISMPALITGRRLAAVAPDQCDLTLTFADTGASAPWTATPPVFFEARQFGVNSALVGWYQPYSHLLGSSLTYCSWYPLPLFEPARSLTFGGSIFQQIAALGGPFRNCQMFVNICQESLHDSLSLVADPRYGLILLHLPPPHAPWVYLPKKDQFTCLGMNDVTGYLNNLALADKHLGALRQALESSGQIKSTWIIQSSDHSWRRSKEYDGKRDFRVPFLVRPPGDGGAYSYSRPFNTVLTHDLILAILRGQITNSPGVAAWLDAHGKPDMPVHSAVNGPE